MEHGSVHPLDGVDDTSNLADMVQQLQAQRWSLQRHLQKVGPSFPPLSPIGLQVSFHLAM
jgi:hypothetical protein